MRELEIELGGETLTLVANWKASLAIADNVGDPILMARDVWATKGDDGEAASPRLDLPLVAGIIHAGAKAGGSKKTLDEIGDVIFKGGLVEAQTYATAYLSMIVFASSDEVKPSADDEKK